MKVRRGVGTVVCATGRIVRDPQRYRHGGGAEPDRWDLRIGFDPGETPSWVVALLGGEDTPPVSCRQILYVDGEPAQVVDLYLPQAIAGRLRQGWQGGVNLPSWYQRLSEAADLPVMSCTEDVDLRAVSEAESRLLDLETTQAVVEIRRVAYSDEQLVEARRYVLPAYRWTLRYRWRYGGRSAGGDHLGFQVLP